MTEIDNGAGTILVTLTSQKSSESINLRSSIPILPTSIRLLPQAPKYQVRLTSTKVENLVVVELKTEVAANHFSVNLLFKQRPEFLSRIVTVAHGAWDASFNNRRLSIRTIGNNGLTVMDTDSQELIAGGELRSVKNFLEWHVKSRRVSSEVARLWTTP